MFAGDKANLGKLREMVNDSLHGYELVIDETVSVIIKRVMVKVIKNPFPTPLVPSTLLGATLVLLLVWHRECTLPQRRAQEIWLSHERVISDIAVKKPGSLSEYQRAYDFFHELTGMTIPSNHTYVGPMPNKATGTALEPLRRWYTENKDRLYWDEEHDEVRLVAAGD